MRKPNVHADVIYPNALYLSRIAVTVHIAEEALGPAGQSRYVSGIRIKFVLIPMLQVDDFISESCLLDFLFKIT